MSSTSYQAHAPVKINLALHVIGQRPDGFHELDSLVVFARPGDTVRMEAAGTDSFAVSGEFGSEIGVGADNLVMKAKHRFQTTFVEFNLPNLAIELEKNLPIASGIGGGSADAAATLLLLSSITRGHDDKRVQDIARHLGADVPMCLSTTPKRVRGAGEQIEAIPHFPSCHAVLVNPLKPVSTPQVFAGLAKRDNPPLPDCSDGWNNLDDLATYLDSTRNDLAGAALALVPEIAEIERILRATKKCHFARMSGSGATVFGLFATKTDADQAEEQIRKQRPDDWISTVEIYDSAKFAAGQ